VNFVSYFAAELTKSRFERLIKNQSIYDPLIILLT